MPERRPPIDSPRPDDPPPRRSEREELAARARELDAIQSFGRRAAETSTPRDLFATTVSALLELDEIELAAVAHVTDDRHELLLYMSRPVTQGYVEGLSATAARLLEWRGERPVVEQFEMKTFDAAHAPRRIYDEARLVLLPIVRGAVPIAYFFVLPGAESSHGGLRLLYSATNQLSLHLERILNEREAEADRFRAILESMPQGVVLTDDRLRTVQANAAAARIFQSLGADASTPVERVLKQLGLEQVFLEVRAGRALQAEEEVTVDDGRAFGVTITPLTTRRRSSQGWVIVLTDISERRRLQEGLLQAEKMSSLGQMISGVAHELNNPLASISGYAQLLRSSSSADKLNERLEVLYGETLRCQKIVANLLSFARSRPSERTHCSLNEVIRSVVSLMSYQLRVDDIRLETELSPELPALNADTHQLQQVLVNLLTNAQQAILEKHEGGTICIRTVPDGESGMMLDVQDTGPGIPEAICSRIFDPFFTTKSEGKGTGLGLSLVYGTVTAHGGTVEAPRTSGGGATIRIRLPGGGGRELPVESAPRIKQAWPPRRGRILVVDDEEPLARVLREALEERGHEVEVASGGHEALAVLARARFDLIISDIKMPGMGGEHLYDEIRRSVPGMASRLMLTTGDTVGRKVHAIEARTGLEILPKPFDLDRLCDRVQERLESA